MITQCMARGVRTKQLSRKRLPKTARPSKSCVVHFYVIVGKTGKVRGCGMEGRSRKFQSTRAAWRNSAISLFIPKPACASDLAGPPKQPNYYRNRILFVA
jgi:hypothetical protein